MCDKVMLRFSERFWPVSHGGIIRWYGGAATEAGDKDAPGAVCEGGDAGMDSSVEGFTSSINFVDWLDLTDHCGSPVVMAFIAGKVALSNYLDGKTDEEIALCATAELERWAQCVERDQARR
jgi:hypothetical protein